MRPMVDVLVVGAGPTGLTLATELSRWGLSVRIVDRAPGPQPGSRGFGIKPRTLEIFDSFGVADEFVAASGTNGRTRVHLGGALLADFTVKPDRPTPARPFPNYVSLPQWRTEAILRDGLARRGVTVEFGTTMTEFADDGSSVLATFEDGSQERVRYLVGCDGGRSSVRKALGIGFEGRTDDVRALLADVDVSGLKDHAVHIWGGDEEMLALRPYREGEPWQAIASIGADEEPTLEWLQRAAVERSGVPGLRVTSPRWLSVWRYSLRIAERYRSGRVFIAGDAAHVHSPFGAFGLNSGVQDAYNLGWKLALVLQGAPEALLDTYEEERLPVGRAILEESDRRFASATAPPRFLRPILPYVVKRFLARLNKRGRNDHPRYYESPLTIPGKRRLRAGDTAPDGVGRTADGRVRLFDLFRERRFTLLAIGREVPELSGPVDGYAIDVEGKGYPRSGYVLVRPDGYVAAVTDDVAEVTTYLRRWTESLILAG
ncbi:FAD-dependent monooxygenase [Kribbella sp. NPDC048928]|uniref:FAD-dependent monooxygenase n=1 Tax=Kribbella sp. NPDC048928 TaxID=3364111 RepID=UPI003718DB5F